MTFTTLISAAELAQHVFDHDLVVLDCRHDLTKPEAGQQAFAEGHIPNAQFAHLDHELAGEKVGADGTFRGRHPLPDRATFIANLRRWGINDNTQVVAYDAHGGMFAARLWWMLKWVGHDAVAVLDGGLPAWLAHGMFVSTEASPRTLGTLTDQPALVASVNADDILKSLNTATHTIVDARAPDRFRGENETLDPVGGHIPGAKNRFFKDNLQADGRFKSADQLRSEFSELIKNPETAVMQCGSGVTACHNLLALEVAGLTGAALYPGSWSEWCSDPARPVAQTV
ncbi:sulfurtransferase [Herminiimonas fonticola]|uniref:Sulfurtransferase n=1 Tax=Herminiimonas fonticola TaxID=303380 RepID=A0A4R6G3H4_9BURK|nr:sulfurtransferase [Herminiimonas fonticola]RBA23173.1 Rhodanese-related sulfurtransferase [Herminiimonas fonticola]TDN88892.1 thiosulfate/3-mercaptopyruvate sulfurtransferase [Herminiimonas fonticola]